MLPFPNIDPVIFSLGPLKIRWYGLMYILGFIAAHLLVRYQAKQFACKQLLSLQDNLNLFIIAGVILGGRLGYVAFYNASYYAHHPLEILATWQGGMSFHGGCIGVLLAGALFCWLNRLDYWTTADLYVVTVPIGLGLGRIGNFLNGELFGRISDVPWAMIFPGGGPLPRHPSQLYEVLLEGVFLFLVLWSVKKRPWQAKYTNTWPHGSMLALFLILYGIVRCIVEFFREPDPQLGLLMGGMTMGQILSLTMIITGVLLWQVRRKVAETS
ncbi:MAG: prolipoprotein diacylglyceryl transferase [Desulfobulbus sp.]|nr:MAG: prolipoprotein diacylglyceryl transferase [Desulfobulbus sp.]RUM36389.1 MAG: prolipoprotein diacylglyceryl transferase [Desulfobulbus sp.]